MGSLRSNLKLFTSASNHKSRSKHTKPNTEQQCLHTTSSAHQQPPTAWHQHHQQEAPNQHCWQMEQEKFRPCFFSSSWGQMLMTWYDCWCYDDGAVSISLPILSAFDNTWLTVQQIYFQLWGYLYLRRYTYLSTRTINLPWTYDLPRDVIYSGQMIYPDKLYIYIIMQ